MSVSLLMMQGISPFSDVSLVKHSAFLGSLHAPSEVQDLGAGEISHVERLILFEKWLAKGFSPKRLSLSIVGLDDQFSVSAAVLGPGADIWKLCQHLGSMVRAMRELPRSIGRFLPGWIGADHGRLGHVVWEKCGHGLTCRPRSLLVKAFLTMC